MKHLNQLIDELKSAKQAETAANLQRLEIEKEIVKRFPCCTLEGIEGDKDMGLTITYKVTRKVDTEALQTNWMSLPGNAQKAFRWKADVDTKQYRAIQDLDPAAFSQIAAFVTTTPAKPSITLKD